MLQTHTFKLIWTQTKHAPDMPDTAPATTQQSKPRAANPRVLQRTERLLEEGPAAVGVALKIIDICLAFTADICPVSTEDICHVAAKTGASPSLLFDFAFN